MTWFHAARARLRLLPRQAAESRIDDEIRFHIDMETERLVREQKLDRDEARRRALVTFGGAQQHRETLREGRGTSSLNGLSLDLKLGFRMLAKYPGLTVVGGLAMAFGIWFGAVTFHMFGILQSTKLPLPDGDRIVKIQNWDAKLSADEDRVLYDYQFYRGLRSITDLGAYRDASANVVGADGSAKPAVAAEITASAFLIAPERPLHGRVLDARDERPGAPPVAVLGYELWRTRFDGNPNVVGRSVQLGTSFATIVGVMPEGYAFPVSHELWMPLRTDAPAEPRRGMEITVFGRLAPGISFEDARTEVTSLAKRIAVVHPETHAHLQPHVLPYTQVSVDEGDMLGMTALIYFFIVALVAIVCSTVALLLFARAASRETEILVRSALGASRGRIVAQLFAEALVLAGVAATVGLLLAQVALTNLGRPYLEMNYGRLPFWYDFDLSPLTIAWALALALLGALITGVMPARKITRGFGARLRAGTAGGGGVSFGGVWTAVIVTQVALTVAFPGAVMFVKGELKRLQAYDIGFRGQEYLGVKVGIGAPPGETLDSTSTAALATRLSASVETLRRRLEAEPGIAGVTFVDRRPADYHAERRLEVASLPGSSSAEVALASIDPSYFAVLQAPVRGRAFSSADASPHSRVVIVDQGFADLVMPGRNPVGHQVRISSGRMLDSNSARLPLYEIVGVVKELGMAHPVKPRRTAGVYLPFIPGSRTTLSMIVRGSGDPLMAAPRIRELATSVDPTLRIDEMKRFDQVTTSEVWFVALWVRIMMGLTAVALLLSLAGIYSVLSYTVARRTREIGVRVALGASERRVITSIFRKPLTQVVIGVAIGSMVIALAFIRMQYMPELGGTGGRGPTVGEIAILMGYAILMLGVCLLACVVPTVRALRVQPTEALRAE
jgi:putative ABC transport system permease protein